MDIILDNQAEKKQGSTACLNLGSRNDPAVCFGYANPNNYCYRTSPPEAVRLSYQERVCLSTAWVDCPVYQPDWNGSFPREISASPQSSHRSLLIWAAIAIVVGVIALVLWYAYAHVFARSLSSDSETQPTLFISAPAQENLSTTAGDLPLSDSGLPTSLPLIAPLATSTSSPTLAVPTQFVTNTPAPSPTVPSPSPSSTAPLPSPTLAASSPSPTSPPAQDADTCQPPDNWKLYTVRPGDTLSLLGQLSGASVAEIRTANCLSKTNLIYVGQKLYLPNFYPSSGGSSAPTAQPGRNDTPPLPPPDR